MRVKSFPWRQPLHHPQGESQNTDTGNIVTLTLVIEDSDRDLLSEKELAEAPQQFQPIRNYHRPHTACADQPPATRVHEPVDNVMTSYT